MKPILRASCEVTGASLPSCDRHHPGRAAWWVLPALLGVAAWLLPAAAPAYPPAPSHTLYGLVRDQMGNAITVTNAEIILETSSGIEIKTTLTPNLGPGLNYRLRVPMDAGLTSEAYKPTALQPTVPFRLKVKIGQTTYLPIEMTGRYTNLGAPAQSTRLDLTLGEDADGDGLPDAWERALIAALGKNLTIQDIRPEDDADHDGLSNLQEYVAGTYAFDPQDGFSLSIAGLSGDHALLEFLAISGRSYSLLASSDLKTWTPIQFRVPAEGAAAPTRDAYQATDVRVVRVEALVTNPPPPARVFFKALVQ